jgi:hypothetical protein
MGKKQEWMKLVMKYLLNEFRFRISNEIFKEGVKI